VLALTLSLELEPSGLCRTGNADLLNVPYPNGMPLRRFEGDFLRGFERMARITRMGEVYIAGSNRPMPTMRRSVTIPAVANPGQRRIESTDQMNKERMQKQRDPK
jgi:hypothetical protein